MTAEILAATEHLVLRRMTNDDDAALAAIAQPGVWLQIGIETSGRLIGDIAVRVDGDDQQGPVHRDRSRSS